MYISYGIFILFNVNGVYFMKKKMLTLMATVAIFAASPVFAMENENLPNISAKKNFAVVANDDLKVNVILNYHAEITESQPPALKRKGLFGFEIKKVEERDGVVAFPVSWQNVQYYTRDFDRVGIGGIYPWDCLIGQPEVNRYRVVEDFKGVVRVNMNENPYTSDDENVYYSAIMYKALPGSKALWLHAATGSNVRWTLDGTWQDFTLAGENKKIMKQIESGEWNNIDPARERGYQQKMEDERNELKRLVKKALVKK